MPTYTKKQLVEKMKAQLQKDDQAQKALLRLYEYQTQAEKASSDSHVDNGVGFSKFDSEILSSYADQLIKRKFLSSKQMSILKLKITKYATQLVDLAIGKGLIIRDSRTSYHVAGQEAA